MRTWLLAGLLIATAASAEPPGDRSPMTLPGGGGYIQPGNPNRSITAVGRESALVRQRDAERRASARTIECASRRGPQRCLVRNAGVTLERRIGSRPCRSGRDWRYDARSITVLNGCHAVFGYRPRS